VGNIYQLSYYYGFLIYFNLFAVWFEACHRSYYSCYWWDICNIYCQINGCELL